VKQTETETKDNSAEGKPKAKNHRETEGRKLGSQETQDKEEQKL